jgi:AcrR family transcriptional regulator
MAARSVRTAGEVPLSKQRVVTESIRLADSEGVDKLSMRRLADELGAGVMSLYYYVANKDELLDAMIDVVFDEIGLPSDRGGWKAAMWQRAMSARRVLGRHPWAITLMESRTTAGPANLRHHEAVLACLREAGFSVEMATHVYWLLDSYVYGFALQEASLPFDTAKEFADMGEDVYMPQPPTSTLPEQAPQRPRRRMRPRGQFTFRLDLILGALGR